MDVDLGVASAMAREILAACSAIAAGVRNVIHIVACSFLSVAEVVTSPVGRLKIASAYLYEVQHHARDCFICTPYLLRI